MAEDLHLILDELEGRGANWQRLMTAHALVDAGYVTIIECMMPTCIYDDRLFEPEKRARALSIDHILPLSQGGSHHADNLRLAHHGCNSAASRKYDETKLAQSKAAMLTRRRDKYRVQREALQVETERADIWLERWSRQQGETWQWLDSTRRLQRDVYHINYEVLIGDELAEYVTWNTTALISEVGEFLNEIQWKNWATDRGRVNRDEAVGELVDVGHFLGNLLVALGVSDIEWEVRYMQKQRKNAERQAVPGGYTNEKCPKCRRELDRDGALVLRDGEGVGGRTHVYCAYCDARVDTYAAFAYVNYECSDCHRELDRPGAVQRRDDGVYQCLYCMTPINVTHCCLTCGLIEPKLTVVDEVSHCDNCGHAILV